MCLIIDANRGHTLIAPVSASRPIIQWLEERGGVLAVGGKLLDELSKNFALRRKLIAYNQAGICRMYPKERIEAQYPQLDDNRMKSNDTHILGLARVSGCRLLHTHDRNLSADFRNRKLVPPRDGCGGAIYRDERDREKLYNCPSCR